MLTLVGESGSGKTVSALSILRLLPYPTASHPTGRNLFEGGDLLTMSEGHSYGLLGVIMALGGVIFVPVQVFGDS